MLKNITILLITLLATGCSGFQAEQDAGEHISAFANTSFQLNEGDTADFEGIDLSVTFTRLKADSRCPRSTTEDAINCFWEGQVEADFSIRSGSDDEKFSLIGFVGDGTTSLTHVFGDFVLHLERVDPYPTLPDPSDDPVVATLRLERAE